MNFRTAEKKSFKKAYESIMIKDQNSLNEKLMQALRITTIWSLRLHIAGKVATHPEDLEKVERIFKDYGISPCFDNEK